jgi:hypothetical protein
LLGEVVARLANNNFEAGIYHTDFNASALNSGVYFYSLEAKGTDESNFVSTKKMLVIK